jgi:nucleoside-diphosphate-sugar epimerase
MKIFVAGATGAVGMQLVPRLVARDHEVVAMTRTASKQDAIRALGATPVVADALNPDDVARAVAQAEPDVIVHELTALPEALDIRHFDREFELTNRLRTEGTDHLLAAGRAIGIQRFVAQSYAGWPFARSGPAVKTEEDELDPHPVPGMARSHAAIRYLERAVVDATWTDGIVLRYGGLYGPGTSLTKGGAQAEMIRKRKFPVVGSGAGVWSFVHVADAAEATVAAVEHGSAGIYNVTDEEPAPVSEWLPIAAAAAGGKPPWKVPTWVGRMLAGNVAVTMMTEIRGASNAKAKRELGWRPRHASWREGFPAEFAEA